MNHACLFLFGLLSLMPTMTNAQPSITAHMHVAKEEHEAHIATYLKNLEELGYCVIPNVLSAAEAETLYKRVWHEFIEKAWPNCKMDVLPK